MNRIKPGISSAPQIRSNMISVCVIVSKENSPLKSRNEAGAVRETMPALFLSHS